MEKTSRGTRHDTNLIDKVFPDSFRALSGKDPSEKQIHILDALRNDELQPVHFLALERYDYIIASHKEQIRFLEQVLSTEQLHNICPHRPNFTRILALSMPIRRADELFSEDMALAFKSIERFMETHLGWQCPQRSLEQGPFRTGLVRIRLKSASTRKTHELDYQIAKAERDSGCRLYWLSYPRQHDERVLAIVGAPEKLARAWHILDDVLDRHDLGFITTRALDS